jgi:imidazolonepropionase
VTEAATLVIRGIGALVTCDPRRTEAPGVIADAILVAAGESIVYAGPQHDCPELTIAADAVELDANGHAVVPGFVDAHTHIAWVGDRAEEYALRAAGRGCEEIAAAGGGIRSTVRTTSAASVDELRVATVARARRMLSLGTTTVEVKSGYGLSHDAEMRQLDVAASLDGVADLPMVVPTYLPLHAQPDGDREAYIAAVCGDGVADAARRAGFCDVFCDQGAFTVAECERVLHAAVAAGMRPKLHAEQRSHSGGAQLAARVGAVSADHLEHADDDDVTALARAGVVAVLLPGAALVLGGPPPPGRRLLDGGVEVAIATDCNPGTCFAESMPLMMSLAVATAGLTPAQALVGTTRGGAAALGLVDRGVLAAGMRCDAVVLDTPHWLDLAYHLGAAPVGAVVRGGRAVVPSR